MGIFLTTIALWAPRPRFTTLTVFDGQLKSREDGRETCNLKRGKRRARSRVHSPGGPLGFTTLSGGRGYGSERPL